MVNKRFQSSIVTRRRSFPPDLKKRRPKRNISPKVLLEDTVSGLSWKEERELKKALYASLQESRRSSRDERPDGDGELSLDSVDSAITDKSSCSSSLGGLFDKSNYSQDTVQQSTKAKSTETNKNKYHAQRKFAQNSMPRLHSETPPGSFQKKIHAQRKFAHGSHPSTPSETPSKPKFKASPVRLFPVRPKTEDFLTYLCFRGTNLLPPHLDLLNVTRDTENIEPSTPLTNGRPGQTRESSPASSSTLSHNNEDSMDIPDLAPRSQTPNRKAARASASTPETARGFLPYRGSGSRHSIRNASPLSKGKQSSDTYGRTRHTDRFLSASRVLKMKQKSSPMKGTATDRLSLKRKAMATLNTSKSDKRHGPSKVFKKTLSDGELMKRKVNVSCNSELDVDDVMSDIIDIESRNKLADNINVDYDIHGDLPSSSCNEYKCCKVKPDIDMGSHECFNHCCTADSRCSDYSSAYNCDGPSTALNKCLVSENLSDLLSSLNKCTNSVTKLAKQEEFSQLIDNVDVKHYLDIDMNATEIDTQDKNLPESTNIHATTYRNVYGNKMNKENDEGTTSRTDIKVTKAKMQEPTAYYCNKTEAFECKTEVQGSSVETESAFVSSLFTPLSSDSDEPIDISVSDDISLDASIDMEDLLNCNVNSGLDNIRQQPNVLPFVNDTGLKTKFLNNSIKTENCNIGGKIAKKKINDNIIFKSDMNNNKLTKINDINNNMFKPAFLGSPKSIFGTIVELASSISPKNTVSATGPVLISRDHTYSKTKTPVHFSMKSVSLKCKEIEPFMFTQSKTLNHLKTSQDPIYSYPVEKLKIEIKCRKELEEINSKQAEEVEKDCQKKSKEMIYDFQDDDPADKNVCLKIMRDRSRETYKNNRTLQLNSKVAENEEDKLQTGGIIHVCPAAVNSQDVADKSPQAVKSESIIRIDRETMRRKDIQANLRDRHPTKLHRIEKKHSPSRASQPRKRKSSDDLYRPDSRDSSPPTSRKPKKLRSSARVRNMLKAQLQTKSHSGRLIHRKYYTDFYETHPIKRLSTSIRPKPVKHKGPVTRASSHLKSVLTSAKLAATKKLRMLRASQTPVREHDRLLQVTDTKRSNATTPKRSPPSRMSSRMSGPPSPKKGSNTSPKSNSHTKADPLPKDGDKPSIVLCPTFNPTEEQFKDPLEYIQSIAAKAEPYGMCKIVPPASWKMESRVIDDLRFMCQNQYVHKLLHRWGPNAERLEAIKRHFESTGTEKFQCPQIGGVEVDLVKLFDVVQRYGGMKRILDKKKWMKVADALKLPKQAQDRITKLYSVYCKFLLSFETLSEEERQKIEHSVQTDRQKLEKQRSPCNTEKCVEKGRAQPFSAFNRAARNTLAMFGREDNESWTQIESDYWDYVESGQDHVCVQKATLDTSIYGSMFPVRRDNPYSRHPWNLHNFIQSKGCVLNHLGLIADVTVPTLQFGMLYTTSCLSCNSHNLPIVQYLHQGADIIWYAVPKQKTSQLKKALKEILPSHVRDKGFIVEKDSVMVPPDSLVEHGVSISRCIQSSREFVVVFSGVYHCNISCGYTLSESVNYASQNWIPLGCQAAKDLSANHDPELFSMDAMLVFLARDVSTTEETLSLILPYLKQVVDRELSERQKLSEAGLKNRQKLQNKVARLSPKSDVLEEIIICDVSKKICYLSMVLNENENSAFSLEQGLIHIKKKKKDLPNCKLMYRFSEEELKALVKDVKERIHKSEAHSTPSPTRMTLRNSTEKLSPSNTAR